MAVISIIGLGMFIYRYKDMPRQERELKLLSREFVTFSGAMVLFLIGLIVALGTSSPIIGRLFVDNPTPPEVSFYNNWTMPLAMITAVLTVFGQYIFWKRQDPESLARELTWPVAATCVITLATIMIGGVHNIYYMIFLLAAWFALIGNGVIVYRLAIKQPKLIGGALTHVGFGILLLGILASSAYTTNLLDRATQNYNNAIEQGKVTDEQGFKKTQKVNFLELKLNEPKVVNDKYKVTYEGYTLKNQERPGQQQYRIKFEPADGEGEQFIMNPQVYPMLSASTAQNIQWSVDPDVRSGLFGDIYMYVSGSSYVQEKNDQAKKQGKTTQPASVSQVDTTKTQKIKLKKGQTASVADFDLHFSNYSTVDSSRLQDSTIVAVRAQLEITPRGSDVSTTVNPLFSIYNKNGESWSYAPPISIPGHQGGSIQFSSVDPAKGEIELTIRGVDKKVKDQWVLLVAEEKPFISIVWLGTFLLMAGFSVSIFRHWGRERKKS
jgi:cytochrome c-type biogenesis protein CcmF